MSPRKAYPERFWREIAQFVQEEADPKRPAMDLAEAYNVSDSVANRWIREARKRGLLPPSDKTNPDAVCPRCGIIRRLHWERNPEQKLENIDVCILLLRERVAELEQRNNTT